MSLAPSAGAEQLFLGTDFQNTILPKQLHSTVYIRIFSAVGPNSFAKRPTTPTPDNKHDDWEGVFDVFGGKPAAVSLCPTQTAHILSWGSIYGLFNDAVGKPSPPSNGT